MNYDQSTFEELAERGESLNIQIEKALEDERFDHARKYAAELLDIWVFIREARSELNFN